MSKNTFILTHSNMIVWLSLEFEVRHIYFMSEYSRHYFVVFQLQVVERFDAILILNPLYVTSFLLWKL